MGKGVKRETNKGGSITTFLSKAEDFQGIYIITYIDIMNITTIPLSAIINQYYPLVN
jgi:hypothetical protein